MRIGYVVNRYPAVSHTFIRREIRALEDLGASVVRFSIRDTGEQLIDDEDMREAEATVVLLQPRRLLQELFSACLSRPLSVLLAIRDLASLYRSSEAGIIQHLAYLGEACRLRRECSKQQVDHIHAHFGTNSTTVAMLCRRLGGPTFSFTVHGPEEFDRPRELSLGLKIHRASFVVAISSFCRSQLQRWCPYPEWKKVRIVRCGLDNATLRSNPSSVPSSRRLLCVARLVEQKGLMALLDASEMLVADGLDFRIRIVGEGDLRRQLEERILNADLSDRVELAGAQTGTQIRRELEEARCMVLPSFAEGLPVVIMESFAACRPVITTYIAGIPELVTHGVSGWLVPASDTGALAAAMRDALDAPPERLQEMGQSGRAALHGNHSSRHEAQKLLEAICDYAR